MGACLRERTEDGEEDEGVGGEVDGEVNVYIHLTRMKVRK